MKKQQKRSWNRRHEWRIHHHGNEHRKHPAYVYAASGDRRKFLCFTHSSTTNGISNVKLRHNVDPEDSRDCYLMPRTHHDTYSYLEKTDRKFRIHPDDRETVKKYKK